MMKTSTSNHAWGTAAVRSLVLGGILLFSSCADSAPPTAPPPPPTVATVAEPDAKQQVFATPDEAIDALVTATRNDRKQDLWKILGPHAGKLIYSGDPVADQESRKKFLTAYDKAHRIDSASVGHDALVVGDEEWPMPIPLVRARSGWWFDTKTGEEEILNRRIGRNELNVIEICRLYVDAQREFSVLHPVGWAEREYAQRFSSTAGWHDGLYWPTADGQPESPFGPLIAEATGEGYTEKALSKHTPYHGYFYRILKAQGPHAAGGAAAYVVDGHMTGGFALIAFPARYGDSGVMTFIVNQYGIVYEKNLGSDTAKIARSIASYDPDISWHIVRE